MFAAFLSLCTTGLLLACQAKPLTSSTQPDAAAITPVFTLQATAGQYQNQYIYLNGYSTDGTNPQALINFTFTTSSTKASQFFVDTQHRYLHPYNPKDSKSASYIAIISDYYNDVDDFGSGRIFMDTAFASNQDLNYPILCPGVNYTIGAKSRFNCNYRTATMSPRPSHFFTYQDQPFLELILNDPSGDGSPVSFAAQTVKHL